VPKYPFVSVVCISTTNRESQNITITLLFPQTITTNEFTSEVTVKEVEPQSG